MQNKVCKNNKKKKNYNNINKKVWYSNVCCLICNSLGSTPESR